MFTFIKRVLEILGQQYIFNVIFNTLKLPSAILLIIANLIPLFGFLFLGWNQYDILILYWVESIVIGIYNFFRIRKAKGEEEIPDKVNRRYSVSETSFFFFLHYGIFISGHGFALMQLGAEKSSFFQDRDILGILAFFVALMISHGFSYYFNYIGRKEYLYRSPERQMIAPYGRIVLMHITLIIGAMLFNILPSGTFLLFIFLKIFFDLLFHVRVHTQQS